MTQKYLLLYRWEKSDCHKSFVFVTEERSVFFFHLSNESAGALSITVGARSEVGHHKAFWFWRR